MFASMKSTSQVNDSFCILSNLIISNIFLNENLSQISEK